MVALAALVICLACFFGGLYVGASWGSEVAEQEKTNIVPFRGRLTPEPPRVMPLPRGPRDWEREGLL